MTAQMLSVPGDGGGEGLGDGPGDVRIPQVESRVEMPASRLSLEFVREHFRLKAWKVHCTQASSEAHNSQQAPALDATFTS
mmetsp:Transcript_23329/g.66425  ORF Transcript_23329/g.66425 Transcript_23329/m.66425 type:complete len:81 (+) Transcript_23329:1455-1697(+)